MKKIERKSKTEYVPLGKMAVSALAQREARSYRVDELLASFDVDRIGHPVVSEREGRYYIVDGQHRVEALKRWNGPGWEAVAIECQVYFGLTEQAEAEMFLLLNDTLRVGVFDRFTKAITAGRPAEVAVKTAVEKQGLSIAQSNAPGAIKAVSTLLKVYHRSDSATLGRTLRIIRDSFGDTGFDAKVIDGIGYLCQRYNGVLDEQFAKKRLGETRGGVRGLLGRATDLALRTGNSKAHCVAAAAVDIINSHRGGKKLPAWWSQK